MKAVKKLQRLRKEADIVNKSQSKESIKDRRKGMRGVKPNEDYLNIAIDNLELLFIEYLDYPYEKNASEKDRKERIRRRNEISALESRVKKRIECGL